MTVKFADVKHGKCMSYTYLYHFAKYLIYRLRCW